jgi:hypothetical protein
MSLKPQEDLDVPDKTRRVAMGLRFRKVVHAFASGTCWAAYIRTNSSRRYFREAASQRSLPGGLLWRKEAQMRLGVGYWGNTQRGHP